MHYRLARRARARWTVAVGALIACPLLFGACDQQLVDPETPGVIDPEAIDTVFSDMENRYRGQHLNSAAAMAEYLRQHAMGDDHDLKLLRLRSLLDEAPEGSA